MKETSAVDIMLCRNCSKFDPNKDYCKLKRISVKPTYSCPDFEEKQEGISLFRDICAERSQYIVGEEKTIHTLILVGLGGALVTNAVPTSSNLLINDISGAGKDYILGKILDILPEKKVYRRKRISERVLTYWHNAKFEPGFTWDGKILYLEDCSNSVLNSEVFKVLSSSEGTFTSTILINQLAVDIEIQGKPVLLLTIASPYLEDELLRRFPVINLDISKEQTTRILKYKAEGHSKVTKYIPSTTIIAKINSLNRVGVTVPYSYAFVYLLDHDNVLARTNFDRLVDYVKFSAAIHQETRERDANENVIANQEDYEIARVAIMSTFNRSSVPMTRNQKTIYSVLEANSDWLSTEEISKAVPSLGERQVRRELAVLVKKRVLLQDKQERDGLKQRVYCYKIGSGLLSLVLPPFNELLQNYDKGDNLDNQDRGDNDDIHDNGDKTQRTFDSFVTFDTDKSVMILQQDTKLNVELNKKRLVFDVWHKCSVVDCNTSPCALDSYGKPFCERHQELMEVMLDG